MTSPASPKPFVVLEMILTRPELLDIPTLQPICQSQTCKKACKQSIIIGYCNHVFCRGCFADLYREKADEAIEDSRPSENPIEWILLSFKCPVDDCTQKIELVFNKVVKESK